MSDAAVVASWITLAAIVLVLVWVTVLAVRKLRQGTDD